MPYRSTPALRFLIALITLGAFSLRIYRLAAQSLWYDEGVTAEVARRGIAELTRWTAGDIQPPLYYYLVAGWGRMAGWSEWSLRYPSLVFGVLIVPLLAATAFRLFRSRLAAVFVALMAALHPLLLYYSQEARMYALLTLLAVVMGYAIARASTGAGRPQLNWAIFILAAAAAVYTHYFAFFLLPAFSIAYLLHAGIRARPRPWQHPAAVVLFANLAVFLLFLPWLANLLSQLAVDASYWAGEFKLLEAVRHIGIGFTTGESMLETDAIHLLAPYAALTLVALFVLLLTKAHRTATLYSLLWIAVPVIAILGLASIAPKFNSRYVMIALPGLLLLWAGGLAAVITRRAPRRLFTLRMVQRAFALILFAAALTGFIIADRNWFMDPAFTKAEWRDLSAFVRSQVAQAKETGSDESIVLVSGHAWPIWNYYAPDLVPLRLPELETLDVNAVLDLPATSEPLRNALTGKSGAWLVEWQSRVVDPMSLAPLQLDVSGSKARVRRQFWQIQLSHYTNVDARRILGSPQGLSDRSINFANQVYLLDYSVTDSGDLLLYWQLHPDRADPLPDLNIVAETFTADGLPVARMSDRRPAGYEYPSFRWRSDQILVGRIPALDWLGPGAMPGPYRVRLSLYDVNGDLSGLDVIGHRGQPVGRQVLLDVNLPTHSRGPDIGDTEKSAYAQIIPDLFVQLSLDEEQAEPGQAIPVELLWYAEEKPPDDYNLVVRWRLRSTDEVAGAQILTLTPALRSSNWPDDEVMRTLLLLRPPLNLAPDDYWLELGLTAPDSEFIAVPFRVLGSTRLYTPPPFTTNVNKVFGDSLRLLGVIEPITGKTQAGQQVALTLVWQALARPPLDYSATIQWIGPDARPAAQLDLPLPGGSANWLPSQVELQTFFATTPTTPGTYRLVVAVYDANHPDLSRLPTVDGGDHIDLGEVIVRALTAIAQEHYPHFFAPFAFCPSPLRPRSAAPRIPPILSFRPRLCYTRSL